MGKYTKEDIIRRVMEEDIQFIRMQFTDIFGQLKNVAITASQIEKAVNNQIMIDGSSIEGFVRIEESDQYLWPDLDTFSVLPWAPPVRQSGTAHLRRPQPQRHAVCGRSPERAHAGPAPGQRHGLYLQRRAGAGVFPLPDRRERQTHHPDQRRGGLFRPGSPGPRGEHPPGRSV